MNIIRAILKHQRSTYPEISSWSF